MIWIQGLASFLVWVGIGLWVYRWGMPSENLKPWGAMSSALVMIGSAGAMIGLMVGVAALDGMSDGALTVLGWLGTTFAGAVFVGGQTLGAVLALKTLGRPETGGGKDASDKTGDS